MRLEINFFKWQIGAYWFRADLAFKFDDFLISEK